MSILKRYGIKRTPENIRLVERAVRLVPVREPFDRDAHELVHLRLDQLGKALVKAELCIEDVLPVRWVNHDVEWRPVSRPPLLSAIEALHAFYCQQTGSPDAKMRRYSARDARGKKQHTPALRFVTECLQTRNPKITVSKVEKAWDGRKSKAKKAV